MKNCFILFLVSLFSTFISAQKMKVQIGTDIPYQFYAGVDYSVHSNVGLSLRTGLLTPPYSTVIINAIEGFGADPLLSEILQYTFNLGWMNALSSYYKFGNKKQWFIGPEFRLDHLIAAETPKTLIEVATGKSIPTGTRQNPTIQLKMGLTLYAVGFRIGRHFMLDKSNKHFINIEFSASKHIATQTFLSANGLTLVSINAELNQLMWDDVFKLYGYLGGLGVSYGYRF